MRIRVLALALFLLLFAQNDCFALSYLSNNSIECCSLWLSTITVTKPDGTPYPNCKIYMSVMETRGVIDTTINGGTYFTDSSGKALLAYTPKNPGEKIKISVSCDKAEFTLTVTGVGKAPKPPSIDFKLPDIGQGQIAAVVFILFAAVLIWKGRPLFEAFKKMSSGGGGKKEINKQEIEEKEMSPRRLIMEHERKVAAKIAKKHRRKEVRLNHEFMRKL